MNEVLNLDLRMAIGDVRVAHREIHSQIGNCK